MRTTEIKIKNVRKKPKLGEKDTEGCRRKIAKTIVNLIVKSY